MCGRSPSQGSAKLHESGSNSSNFKSDASARISDWSAPSPRPRGVRTRAARKSVSCLPAGVSPNM
jgi:hypothetical protein